MRVNFIKSEKQQQRGLYFFSSFSAQCGGDLTADSGVIQSPGFPTSYPDNANCEWKIVADGSSRITLTFVDFLV